MLEKKNNTFYIAVNKWELNYTRMSMVENKSVDK